MIVRIVYSDASTENYENIKNFEEKNYGFSFYCDNKYIFHAYSNIVSFVLMEESK